MHHLAALGQILSMIVSCSDRIAFRVCELTLDNIRPESVFIKDRTGGTAETVASGAGMVAHAVKRIKDRVLAHISIWILTVGK